MRRGLLLGVGAVAAGGVAYLVWLALGFLNECQGLVCNFFRMLEALMVAVAVGVAWGFVIRRWSELWAPATCAAAAVLWALLDALRDGSRPEELHGLPDALAVLPFPLGVVTLFAAVAFGIRRAARPQPTESQRHA